MEPTQSNRAARLRVALLGAILAAHVVLLVLCAVNKSASYDEGAHLAAGMAYLRHGEMSIYNLSPPLLRYVAALPAYVAGADAPPAKRYRDDVATSRHWNYFDEFQRTNAGHVHRYVLAGRFMLMPLSLLTAGLIYAWSRRLYGDTGGLLSCAAWCFSPTVIAHGSTLGTDVGCAAAMLLAAWLWQRFLERPTPARVLLAGAAIALPPATKFVGLLIFPLILLLLLVQWLRTRGSPRPGIVGLLLSVLVTFLVINALYRFRLMGDPLDSFRFRSQLMMRVQQLLPDGLPVPFHRYLVEGFDAQKWEADGLYVTVLFDEGYFGSDWRYYPLQLWWKEPLGGLFLLFAALASLAWRKPAGAEWPVIAALLASALGFAFLAQINIGLRYLLPAYALAAILIGRLSLGRLRMVAMIALGAMIVECAVATPRFHSFTSLTARGRRMSVPDTDWGQGLIGLRRWMSRHGVPRIQLLYLGQVNPSEYGIDSVSALSTESPDYVAISWSMLQGVPVRQREGFVFLRPWRQLREMTPDAELDGLNVYQTSRIRALLPGAWVVPIASWEQALAEPTLIPLRNYAERVKRNR